MTTVPRPSKACRAADAPRPHYHVLTHGGLGDVIWLYKKVVGLDLPLFVSVANENRHRPRRSGRLLDHLPRVVGWDYADDTFAAGGQDWPHPDDPSCAIGRTWAELGWRPDTAVPYRIECNRWLEGGRRIEDWLPDLPTAHHFAFAPPGPPARPVDRPAIVLHVAGWPDVPDEIWIQTARMFYGVARVYLVGGSYDHRPRRIHAALGRTDHVTLVEDAAWEDLWAVLAGCDYCFGHASGLTAVADVMGLRGVVFNPRTVPGLVGTWNDETNHDMVHVDRVADFAEAVHCAYTVMAAKPAATWPPTAYRGSRLSVQTAARGLAPDEAAVYAAAAAARPSEVLIACDPPGGADGLLAAVIAAAADGGSPVAGLTAVGATVPQVARVYAESVRISRRAVIDLLPGTAAVTARAVAYDLVVIRTAVSDPDAVRWGWARLSSRGTILVHCPDAVRVVTDVFAGRRVTPAEVEGAPGWVYVHRRA